MGIFDLLLSDSSKKMYHNDFRRVLHEIPGLSSKKRAYIEESFKNELEGGLSKFEIKKRCGKLMHKTGDSLESFEIKKIKEKLLKYFE